jgi:hypothetical protein
MRAYGTWPLCFVGDAGSSGTYRPDGTDVWLDGTDRVRDIVVSLHEAHHGSLNDSTACGAVLHVLGRLDQDRFGEQFTVVLDSARRVHESFATYASLNLAMVHFVGPETVLDVYPAYASLYAQTSRWLSGIRGAHHRFLAAMTAARLSMQTPVIDRVLETGFDRFVLADLRHIDTPDGRWSWLLRQGPTWLSEIAVGVRNRSVRAGLGRPVRGVHR